MRYTLEKTSTPATGSVTLQETKDFFKEDRSVEDSLIEGVISASEKNLRKYTGYVLIETDFTLHTDNYGEVKLPKKPFKTGSVVIKYDDEDGNEQTLDSSLYTVYSQESPVRIDFHGDDLPTLYGEDDNDYPLRIEFTTGYGTAQSDVPEDWKLAIKLLALVYWKRGIPEEEDKNINPLQIKILRSLISDYKINHFK